MTRPILEVIIPAEFPRKPGMTRNDLLNKNASIVRDLVTWIAEKTLDGIISKLVNSTVPIACKAMIKADIS